MIPNIPIIIPMPFAQNGERRDILDNNTVPGSADASWAVGFPPVTRINKQAGGKPPYGLDFQGIFHALSQHLFFAQSGGVYPWMGADASTGFPGLNYLLGAHVLGSDGSEYVALKPSGPDVPNTAGAGFVGPVDPVGDADKGGYWSKIFNGGPDGGVVKGAGGYELCEFYYFRNPKLRPGFMPAQGGVIENAATLYPDAWAYLQTADGQLLCKTEAEWQAMSTAIYYTAADGTHVGWDGIGGAPYFVQDLNAGTLRLPDVRGMYPEAAGFDSLGVGGVHGDGVRDARGDWSVPNIRLPSLITNGVYELLPGSPAGAHWMPNNTFVDDYRFPQFVLSRVVPTSAKVQPRAYGVLACVYLGVPAS